jgi:hypothetical protein
MGNGFWIWLIPLVNNNTSVGIVIDEKMHAYHSLNTLGKAKDWIYKHYPELMRHLEPMEVLDFLGLRNYSYSSKQMFSSDRWACTGEAALFPDPFYSPGSNLIGHCNSIITKLVSDFFSTGKVSERIDFYNLFIISQNEWFITDIQSSYPYFGNSQVESLSFLWDIVVGWSISAPQIFSLIFLDEEKYLRVREILTSFSSLSVRVRKLFIEWSGISKGTFSFVFIDYLAIPFIKSLYDRMLIADKTCEELFQDYCFAISQIEDFVQVIFYMILEDCMPEQMDEMPRPYWINVWAVSLLPDHWVQDGLFLPKTRARDLTTIEKQVRSLYAFSHSSKLVEEV